MVLEIGCGICVVIIGWWFWLIFFVVCGVVVFGYCLRFDVGVSVCKLGGCVECEGLWNVVCL